jgi:mevalonate kinase
MQEYRSNGKLLLTGEYIVLKGAEAIALPLKFGQRLMVEPTKNDIITWQTFQNDNKIFEGSFSQSSLNVLESNNSNVSDYLQNLLTKSFSYRSGSPSSGLLIKTYLDFPFEWGLGSSSTLINNIGQWLKINPFRLNYEITGGSGYDIACAQSENPILYKTHPQLPEFKEIAWQPPFKNHLYFVYTGKKQNSATEVKKFLQENKSLQSIFPTIKKINFKILNANKLGEFEEYIAEHEKILSILLNKETIQNQFFKDFPGKIKSLGAWGGDFVLATWKDTKIELKNYLKRHNLDTFFSWEEIIKYKNHVGQEI